MQIKENFMPMQIWNKSEQNKKEHLVPLQFTQKRAKTYFFRKTY